MVRAAAILPAAIVPALLMAFGLPPTAARAGEPMAASGDQQLSPYSLERSATFEVRNAADEPYVVMVAWPEGEPPARGWPVLYVLDGEDNFAITALTARRLARAGERSGIEAGIVVGIGAGPLARRVRDYTPPVAGYRIPPGQPASGLEIGGSEAFLEMLGQRIMPLVRQRWPVDASRQTLAGHSFGGLLALHALLTRPRLFDAVVAISPSLWFGDGLVERELVRRGPESPRRRLLIAEGDETNPRSVRSMSAGALIERLRETVPSVQGRFLALPGQSHGTTFLAAIAPAIRFAFGR
jgi:predicted alpha/beta superfamily hydrolase